MQSFNDNLKASYSPPPASVLPADPNKAISAGAQRAQASPLKLPPPPLPRLPSSGQASVTANPGMGTAAPTRPPPRPPPGPPPSRPPSSGQASGAANTGVQATSFGHQTQAKGVAQGQIPVSQKPFNSGGQTLVSLSAAVNPGGKLPGPMHQMKSQIVCELNQKLFAPQAASTTGKPTQAAKSELSRTAPVDRQTQITDEHAAKIDAYTDTIGATGFVIKPRSETNSALHVVFIFEDRSKATQFSAKDNKNYWVEHGGKNSHVHMGVDDSTQLLGFNPSLRDPYKDGQAMLSRIKERRA